MVFPLLSAALLSGCYYDEGLTIENMTGTLVIPREAATRDFLREDGSVDTVTDVRLIGPVYLGMFAGVEQGIEDYPHPSVGPQFQAGVPGDTYPYGSTTVGDIRYACFEHLTYQGRFWSLCGLRLTGRVVPGCVGAADCG